MRNAPQDRIEVRFNFVACCCNSRDANLWKVFDGIDLISKVSEGLALGIKPKVRKFYQNLLYLRFIQKAAFARIIIMYRPAFCKFSDIVHALMIYI